MSILSSALTPPHAGTPQSSDGGGEGGGGGGGSGAAAQPTQPQSLKCDEYVVTCSYMYNVYVSYIFMMLHVLAPPAQLWEATEE